LPECFVEADADDRPPEPEPVETLRIALYGIIPTSLTHHSRSGEQFRQPDTPCALS
jgi:hypothetical protein